MIINVNYFSLPIYMGFSGMQLCPRSKSCCNYKFVHLNFLMIQFLWLTNTSVRKYNVGLGLHCLICFGHQISNDSNYQKKFEYFVKFILMKISINLSNMEVYAQPIQNLWLRPPNSGYFCVALTFWKIFSATKSYPKIDFIF
jgi:hypothetical protein